jgi:MFS family permease
MASMLRALRSRNYRLFFVGQGFSLVGTFLTIVATSWLVYRLAQRDRPEEAAAVLGYTGFAAQIPILFIGPFGGVLADRWNERRVLVITQALAAIQSGLLAWLSFTKQITIPYVIWLSVFQGVVNAFDMPARQKLVVSMIEDREDLPNAIALNSSMFNAARLLGPAVAGMVIAKFGVAYCFLFDAFSYMAVIAALLAMIMPTVERKDSGHSVVTELKHGLSYAAGFPPVRVALILTAFVSLTTMGIQVLVPIFAGRLSGEMTVPAGGEDPGATIFGFLTAASGSGALLGGIYLASRKSVRGLGKVISLATLVLGTGIICFGLSQHLVPSLLGMFAMGFGMVLMFASVNTILQTIVEDDKRGRIMSLFGIAIMGIAPFGNLFGGMLATHIGESKTAVISGALTIMAGVLFFLRLPALKKIVRPIYRSKGIIVGELEEDS